MPYLRISRDKRGYEYFALVHTTSGRRGKVRQRTLYWFRTPPNVRVGRGPFDEEVTRALETQYPDVTFDWQALRTTPMPPPSAEHWRERRRAEKAARQFRAAEDEAPVQEPPQTTPVAADGFPSAASEVPASPVDLGAPAPVRNDPPSCGIDGGASDANADAVIQPVPGPGPDPRRRRRRRRGRRGRAGGQTLEAGAPVVDPTESAVSTSIEDSAAESVDEVAGDLENALDEEQEEDE